MGIGVELICAKALKCLSTSHPWTVCAIPGIMKQSQKMSPCLNDKIKAFFFQRLLNLNIHGNTLK